MTQEAEKMGVDGTLQVCPYYNKPSQDGVYAHFKAIADCHPPADHAVQHPGPLRY